jgi:hypothetical protein
LIYYSVCAHSCSNILAASKVAEYLQTFGGVDTSYIHIYFHTACGTSVSKSAGHLFEAEKAHYIFFFEKPERIKMWDAI